ncbi:sensor histidine kinase [Chryseobacterium cheonjiense]|uniref:Histidine kinase n=1 Tax=Chryseobacterium cheonjiense TaxID=2728845 RepID=A0A7Y0FIR6_9FLAO|nr:histidine kinase [Chryseobacterium cheonjiense]NML57490.1 histidine kinase [Chryseobacterium cheonjiense]
MSQIPGLINYNEENGLYCSYNYTLSQDKNGFIWIGSDNGFFRFDGVEFKNYSKGLKNIEILGLTPLSNGEVFIIPFLNDFAYLKNGVIHNTNTDPELNKMQFPSVFPIFFNDKKRDEIMFFAHDNPKNIYRYKDRKIKTTSLDTGLKVYKGFHYDFDSHTLFLQSMPGKIISYNILTKKKKDFKIDANKDECAIVMKNNILITTLNGKKISFYYRASGSFKKLKSITLKDPDTIYGIYVDDYDRLWVSLLNGGILYFDQAISDSSPMKKPYHFLKEYLINGVLVDKDKNIWFSSKNDGIFFLSQKFFTSYINFPINNNSYITAIASNSNSILLGYNSSNGASYSFSKGSREFSFNSSKKIEHRAIYANNDIAIFGQNQEAFQMNLSNFKAVPLKIGFKNVVSYGNNEVLISSHSGLFSYNYKDRKISDTLLNERNYTALPYTPDSLFVGYLKDLYKLNTKTKQKKLFLKDYYFTDLKKLKENLYLGATNLHGIILFNNHKVLQQITSKNGLISNQIKKTDIENDHVFWASSNAGLMRVELKKNEPKISIFTRIDGLPSDKVAGCVIRGDTLYAATSKGLGIFSIKNMMIQQKYINKKVIINSVIIGGKEYFNLRQKISDIFPNNDVIFKLSFLDYASQGKISYKYKVEGLSKSWQISNSSKIILNSLPPGKYIFKVYGLGYNGKRSYIYTELPFEIKPQFWQTLWFTIFVIILIIAVLVVIVNAYIQKLRNKKLKNILYEKKIAELELQAIKAQINPHFIYNCLNSIQFLLYKKDYEETENYLNIFSQMIRKTLQYSEHAFMSINEEVEYLSIYLNMEKLRLKEQFDYKIIVSEEIDPGWHIPSLLVQPFVENAIKHGISGLKNRKGSIEVTFNYKHPALCITIKDNGTGFPDKYELTGKENSFGVKLSQKRIDTFKQLFNTNIILEINNLSEKKQTQGTEIKLYITPYENQITS